MGVGDPLVTIGIPVYNGMPRITGAIESALAQTYQPLEIVISDNASSDGTDAICREYAESHDRITYLSNAENLGATWNFNRVFAEAEGPYFKIMGHDDLLDPTTVEQAVAILEEIFGKGPSEATHIMLQIHSGGLGVAGVFVLEVAETKVVAVHRRAEEPGYPLRAGVEKE